jgi:hypothetical protein
VSVGVFDAIELYGGPVARLEAEGHVRQHLSLLAQRVFAVQLWLSDYHRRPLREVLPGRFPDDAPIANMPAIEAAKLLGWVR